MVAALAYRSLIRGPDSHKRSITKLRFNNDVEPPAPSQDVYPPVQGNRIDLVVVSRNAPKELDGTRHGGMVAVAVLRRQAETGNGRVGEP